MSEPTIASPQEPQGEQSGALSGAHSTRPAPQAYQSPQGMQPPHQGLQTLPRSFGRPEMNKERVTPSRRPSGLRKTT